MRIKDPRELMKVALDRAWQKGGSRMAWALSHLAGIAEVSIKTTVETAQIVEAGGRLRIEFGAAFVRDHLRDADDVLFVLLHEVFHRVHGDLLRQAPDGPQAARVANIVADVLVNRALCEQFFPDGVGILDRFYDRAELACLLLTRPATLAARYSPDAPDPQSAFSKGSRYLRSAGRAFAALGFPREKVRELVRWHREAWQAPSSFRALYDRIRPFFGREIPTIVLLGSHSDKALPARGLPGWNGILSRADQKEGGEGGPMTEEIVAQPPVSWVPPALVAQLHRALEYDPSNPRDAESADPEASVVFGPGRREAFLLAAGVWPVFFRRPMLTRGEDETRVHLYLDVSGSTAHLHSLLYGLALRMGDVLGAPFYTFSTEVAELSMADLSAGRVRSTGGTDLDCVLEHAGSRGFRKVVLLTDGYMDLSDRAEAILRGGCPRLFLLLTGGFDKTPVTKAAEGVWLLKDYGVRT